MAWKGMERPDSGGSSSDETGSAAPSDWDNRDENERDSGREGIGSLPEPTEFTPVDPGTIVPSAIPKQYTEETDDEKAKRLAREAALEKTEVPKGAEPGFVMKFISDLLNDYPNIKTGLVNIFSGTEEERLQKSQDLWDKAVTEAGGDVDYAKQLIGQGWNPENNTVISKSGDGAPTNKYQIENRKKDESGIAPIEFKPATVTSSAPVVDPKAAADAQRQAELLRVQGLVTGYNKTANQAQYTPVDISTATSPMQAEAIKKYNDLIATGAKSEAASLAASAGLQSATQLDSTNRDAWKQYFNPADYKATAAQASAAQSAYTPVTQASTISGNYQGDLSRLSGYDSTIQASSERAAALDAENMFKQRALGLAPSVAENSYLQNMDKLIKSQAAAAAGTRGQNSVLAQEAAARSAAAIGQQAVRETAGLRAQEQQAAETAYAAQANQIMIEDQKLAAQAKSNELQQLVNITQANLENAKSRLESDKFNADAINEVNKLDAQLRTQTSNLNAQLQNSVNLQNASAQNQVSLQNAMQSLEAAKYAGTSAQSALQSQAALERADIASQYGYTTDAANTLASNLTKVASATGTMASGNQSADAAKAAFEESVRRYNAGQITEAEMRRAAEDYRTTATLVGIGSTVAGGPGAVLSYTAKQAWDTIFGK